MYVMKVALDGTMEWSATYGNEDVQAAIGCREVSDGFLVAGSTSNGDNGGYDFLLVKIDQFGDVIWQHSYGTEDWDVCNAVELVPDGVVLGGLTYGGGASNGDGYLIKCDLNGDTLWTRKVGGTGFDEVRGLGPTSEMGILATGSTIDDQGDEDAFVLKCSTDGGLVWSRQFGGDSMDYAVDVIEIPDGRIACLGNTRSYSDYWQMMVFQLSALGDSLWTQLYGTTDDYEGYEIAMRASTGYAVAGYLRPFSAGGQDMFLMLTDSSGWFVQGKNYGGVQDEIGYSLSLPQDGGYITAGSTTTYGPGPQAVYVVKGDSMGETIDDTVYEFLDPLDIHTLVPYDENSLIFPNPLQTGQDAVVSMREGLNSTVRIFDMSARLCLSTDVKKDGRFSTLGLSPGTYSIEVLSDQQPVVHGKLILY